MKNEIFYFTGTGNSYVIGKDLAEGLGDCQLTRIQKGMAQNGIEKDAERIGIVFPVYFSGLPYMVREFVKNTYFPPNAYVFAIGNYGDKVDIAIEQLDRLLKDKDVKLQSAFGIEMPGNYQVRFELDPEEKVKRNLLEEKTAVSEILEVVRNRENQGVKAPGLGTHLKGTLIYSIFKPYRLGENFSVESSCNGCGICKKVCPADNILMTGGRPSWEKQCEHCLACMHLCPKQAIQYRSGTKKRGRYRHPEVSVKDLQR